jgi:hypothetical protein
LINNLKYLKHKRDPKLKTKVNDQYSQGGKNPHSKIWLKRQKIL